MRSTFVERLRRQVDSYGDSRSYTFLRESGRGMVEDVATYRDLDADARSVATWLSSRQEAGQPVMLLFAPGLDFVRAFLGCLYAGVVAVPAPVPHDARSMQRSVGMFTDAGVGLVLTSADLHERLAAWIERSELAGSVTVVALDAAAGAADDWTLPEIESDTTAFLQYTSGSTSAPKGVVVTHGNLVDNEAAIGVAVGARDTDTVVGWLPHFHDMGLIGMLLQPFYGGGNLVFMSPVTFLKRPVRLLQAISRYRAQVTVGPNFSYDLMTKRVTDEQLAQLDLSSLRVALNGAEPLRPHTLQAFVDRFAPAGFAPGAFLTAYGMAEVTLIATASTVGHPPVHLDAEPAALERNRLVPADTGTRLVSSGRAVPGLAIAIVDPDTRRPLPDGHVGEIWIAGGSVAQGYWNRNDDTAATFQAYAAEGGRQGSGPYLRTGDLGSRLDREIFVTGRLKDLIIVNGRNLYPQDIEDAARSAHPHLGAGVGVALSVDTGTVERLVLVQEVRLGDLADTAVAEISAAIRSAVANTFDVAAPSVVLVRRHTILRTTSGKVQRRPMRNAFLHNAIEGVCHEWIDPALHEFRVRTPLTA